MKFSKLLLFLSVILFAQLAGECAANSQAQNPPKPASVSIHEVLWWLPEDTEMIAVDQNTLQFFQNSDPKKSLATTVANVGLGGAGRGEFAEQLFKVSILRIVSGSRKFRDTRGFGLMPYEGCSIISLQSDLPKDHALPKWLTKNANRTEEVADYKAYIFDEKLEQDQWHFLIVELQPNLLLCATNKSYLESVLRRRNRSTYERQKTTRALPANLTEWKYVDTKSSEWALRHYRKDQARLDPTSPFTQDGVLPDKDAIGLTYSLDAKNSVATVRYLTAPRKVTHMTKFYKEFWIDLMGHMNVPKEVEWRPNISAQSNGVVDMKFSFTKPYLTETSGMFAFGLLY